jgi:extradiol dioxygenase family protein
MASEIVIAAYKPHAGKDDAFVALLSSHVPTLWRLGLVTNRAPIVSKAADGTYLEVFEWKSELSAGEAHEHPAVARVWEAMGAIADFVRLDQLSESHEEFPHFAPVRLRAAAPRVYRIAIPVHDIDAAARFYGALLGVAGVRVCASRHNFDCGGTVVACFDPSADGERYDPAAQAAMLYLTVADVDALFTLARGLRFAEIDAAVQDQPWGERSFYGRDPFGNRLCFVAEATTGL